MVYLLFFFWYITPWYAEGSEAGPFPTLKACEDMKAVYEAEGEVSSLCYAKGGETK